MHVSKLLTREMIYREEVRISDLPIMIILICELVRLRSEYSSYFAIMKYATIIGWNVPQIIAFPSCSLLHFVRVSTIIDLITWYRCRWI